MVFHDLCGFGKPEQRHLGQDFAPSGDSVGHHAVVRRNAIGCDNQELVV